MADSSGQDLGYKRGRQLRQEKEEELKWQCSSCSYHGNTQLQQNCVMCGEKRPISMKNKLYSLFVGKDKTWSCPKCTYDNKDGTVCLSCGHHYIVEDREGTSLGTHIETSVRTMTNVVKKFFNTTEDTTDKWACPHCTFINHHDLLECEQCGGINEPRPLQIIMNQPLPITDPPPMNNNNSDDEGWVCSDCTFKNHRDMSKCEQCDKPRREVSYPIGIYPSEPRPLEPLVEPHPLLIESHPLPEIVHNSLQGKTIIDLTGPKPVIICPSCTTINTINSSTCSVCQLPIDTPSSSAVPFQCQQSCSLSVVEIRQQQDDHALATWYTIVEEYKKIKETFIDPEFPHSNHSLYSTPSSPTKNYSISRWMRPHNISLTDRGRGRGSAKWCVYREPRPDDIAQGILGDCWFLSALAVISEVPQLLQEIIITKELCPQGVYLVRLCWDGIWKSILIDDYFPVRRDNGLAFSKARRGQLWVPLIEKALAKMYGCYESLDGGQIITGLSILTGYPCEKVALKNGLETDDSVDQELVWGKLLSFKESKFPMAVSSSVVDDSNESLSHDDVGIQPYHAFSILDMKQIGTESLVLLRDPWGHTNWWKPGHEWMDSEPGTFWIGANDLFKYFSHVDVCHYHPDWHSIRVCGHLFPYAPPNLKVLTFQTFTPTEVKLSLYQPSSKGRSKDSTVDIAFMIVQYEGSSSSDVLDSTGSLPHPSQCVLVSKFRVSSVVTCFTLLNPGRYAVVPLSFSKWHSYERVSHDTSHDSHVPYVLALFSAKPIEWLEQVSTKPGFLSDSLFLLAKKEGTLLKTYSLRVKLYQVHIRHGCYYCVIENHESCHVRIQFNATESINVKSSRNQLMIDDYIPPNHRQILIIFTPLINDASFILRFSHTCNTVPVNPLGQWGSYLSPPLTDTNRELHSPRPIC